MFRDIRKKKNQISTEAAEQLLREARRGILAVNGREGYPYAIPINYYYDREAQKIYFHGARAGHKVEAIRACDKVCFTVYGGETIREEAWAPYLRSVVVFGRCRLLEQSPDAVGQWLGGLRVTPGIPFHGWQQLFGRARHALQYYT